MKTKLSDLAAFGGKPLFETVLPVGQINTPSWPRFRQITHGIFERGYYTNHGALAQELEDRLCDLFKTRHAITVTNATIGLSLAAKAMNLHGKAIVPAFTFAASAQSLTWAGIEPVFCDVDKDTHCLNRQTVEPRLKQGEISAILGVHMWGNACNTLELEELGKNHGVKVFYDAAHAVGCTHMGRPIGTFGECEIFSFHATKILNATEGGVITTNNDDLAESLRNLRSSYGRRRNIEIPINANGRFSEFQAAFCLLSLEQLPENCASNERRFNFYREGLADIPGVKLVEPTSGEKHNFQYVVMEIDGEQFGINRDTLVDILKAENIFARRYFVPGLHKCVPYKDNPQPDLPVTDKLCQKVMQLPSGSGTGEAEMEKIVSLIRFIHENSVAIGVRY